VSKNDSHREAEKNGPFAAFSKAFPETNRVLGKALFFSTLL
jgi:hypothetical protein